MNKIFFFKTNFLIILCLFLLSLCKAREINSNRSSHTLKNSTGSVFIDQQLQFKNQLSSFVPSKGTFNLFTHGKPGYLLINNKWLNPKEIAAFIKPQLNKLNNQLNIFGCEFGKGEEGRKAVQYLQKVLNIDVSASDDITGKNGDWILEIGKPEVIKGLENYQSDLQCANFGTAPSQDYDCDGIINSIDLDDDNDGIPDSVEDACSSNPTHQSIWDINVYTYTGAGTSCLNNLQYANKTLTASGTMDEFPGQLKIAWYNNSVNTNLIPTLNANGGNVTGTAPFSGRYMIEHVHTFTGTDAGFYTIGAASGADDGKIYFKTLLDGTDSVLFCNASVGAVNTPINVYFEPGTKLKIIVNEQGLSDGPSSSGLQGITITVAPQVGVVQTFCNELLDTDGDGIPNHFDLDSDGDGCPDAKESGVPGTLLAGNMINNIPNTSVSTPNAVVQGPYGANGLAASLENNDTSTATTSYPSTYSAYALNKLLNLCIDSDGDGVPDLLDLDDDNDGILDAVEAPACYYTAAEMAIPNLVTTEIPNTGTITNLYDNNAATTFPFTATTAANALGKTIIEVTPYLPTAAAGIILNLDTAASPIGAPTAAATITAQGWNGATWVNLAVYSAAQTITNQVQIYAFTNTTSYTKYRLFESGITGVAITASAVQEVKLQLPANYSPSANQKSTCGVDTDGDGITNNLDLDSDGDGCPDARESGVTGTLISGNTIAQGPYGANGLADSLENNDTSTAVTSYPSTYNIYAIYKFLNICADTDGDGIPDLVDIDDDNDGVVDAIEAPSCYYTATEMAVPNMVTTEIPTTGTIANLYDNNAATTFAFTATTAVNALGKTIFEITPVYPQAATAIILNLNTAASPISAPTAAATLKAQGWNGTAWVDLATYTSAPAVTSQVQTYAFTNTVLYSKYRLFESGAAGVAITASAVQEVMLQMPANYNPSSNQKSTCGVDTDGDGITNNLDLDSDGDGCSDAKEAGATTSSTPNFQFPAAGVGINGLTDSKETTPDSGVINYTSTYEILAVNPNINACTDTDGDGIADFYDLDDDNDGILDTVECGSYDRITSGVFPITGGNTNTLAGWIVDGTYAPSGAWVSPVGRINLSAKGLEFRRDFNTVTTVEQNLSNIIGNSTINFNNLYWNKTPQTSGAAAFVFTVSYAGTIYATITASGTTPTITTSNGATSNLSTLETIITGVTPNGTASTPVNLGITLPSSVPTSGALLFTFVAGTSVNQVNDLGFRSVSLVSCKDTDADGIPDYLDLDSDGDGCPDAIEGGGGFTSANLQTATGNLTSQVPNKNLGNTVGNTATTMGVPTIAGTGQSVGASQNNLISLCLCYKPGVVATAGNPALISKVGITSLNRAGAAGDNWPAVRNGGWLVLEAKTKGFVPNRLAFSGLNPVGIAPANFVEGMMVYDVTNKCMKMYTSQDGGTTFGWYCIATQTCPD